MKRSSVPLGGRKHVGYELPDVVALRRVIGNNDHGSTLVCRSADAQLLRALPDHLREVTALKRI